MKFTRKNRAFTLIELLVVVLILAILTAVALPLYLASVKDSEEKACQTNMKTIATAVQAAHVRDRTAPYFAGLVTGNTGALGTLEDLMSDPLCPADDSDYTVALVGDGFNVKCGNLDHIAKFYWENGAFLP